MDLIAHANGRRDAAQDRTLQQSAAPLAVRNDLKDLIERTARCGVLDRRDE
jgi:hypothetical protein